MSDHTVGHIQHSPDYKTDPIPSDKSLDGIASMLSSNASTRAAIFKEVDRVFKERMRQLGIEMKVVREKGWEEEEGDVELKADECERLRALVGSLANQPDSEGEG